jgi:uncharacterized NAD-dependent epimerase/dehydratase family protein
MLDPSLPIALYAEASLGTLNAKMTEGILRYGSNPVVAVIDSTKAGLQVSDVCPIRSAVPVVASLDEAIQRGAAVLVLGTAPSGGRLPAAWVGMLETAIDRGLHVINGMHDRLEPMLRQRLRPGQWVWDLRVPSAEPPPIAMGRAATLNNHRVLMVGTDMAIGKMTAGLELTRGLRAQGHDAVFLATGQIGIAITGRGIPLDAILVDHAAGAVERMVLEAADHDVLVIEGQGSLLHPGSTATLPLMRGSCCNTMILCHRAGMRHLDTIGNVTVPPLPTVIALYEAVANAGGALAPARVAAIAVDTSRLAATDAEAALRAIEDETGLPTADPVRQGTQRLATAALG